MKIFLAYKFTGSDKNALRNLIESVSEKLNSLGHTTFCFSRDIQNWGSITVSRETIMPTALENLNDCDAILVIVDEKVKSTGIGIEAGYAKARNKKVFLAKRIDVEADYLLSLADQAVEYESVQSLKKSLEKLFN